jgi:hypothetical protein
MDLNMVVGSTIVFDITSPSLRVTFPKMLNQLWYTGEALGFFTWRGIVHFNTATPINPSASQYRSRGWHNYRLKTGTAEGIRLWPSGSIQEGVDDHIVFLCCFGVAQAPSGKLLGTSGELIKPWAMVMVLVSLVCQ